jgi:hypothetical protein
MAGMRDKLIHDYIGVNLEVVWKTIFEDLPVLAKNLRKAISSENTPSPMSHEPYAMSHQLSAITHEPSTLCRYKKNADWC